MLAIITLIAGSLYAQTASLKVFGAPSWAPNITVRAGASVQLDGTGSSCSGGCTYFWQQLAGPSTLTWSSRTASQPTISGTVFGQYQVQLQVTAVTGGAKNTSTMTFGAVSTDTNGVVIIPDAKISKILQVPPIKWGSSPWTYMDERHKAFGDYFGDILTNNANYNAVDWKTALSGTVAVTNGNPVITGTGTDFQNQYCGGGSSPSGAYMVIWYPLGGGVFGKRGYPIASCDNATQITLQASYYSSSTQGSLQHSKMICGGCWVGASDNVNYYDVVLSLYSLYYRTGLTQYLTYARTLAANWWEQPSIDKGRIFGAADEGATRMNPRQWALNGIALWGYESGQDSTWWTLYHSAIDDIASELSALSGEIYDIREQAYLLWTVSTASIVTSDETKRSNYNTAIGTFKTYMTAQRQSGGVGDGVWLNGYYGCGGTTASVTNGSTSVTISGATNGCTTATINSVLFGATISGGQATTNGDGTAYNVSAYPSSTQITLASPYADSTGTKSWFVNVLTGKGLQPFMTGIQIRAMEAAYLATSDSTWRTWIAALDTWVRTYGPQPANTSHGGLYYGRAGTCEPMPDNYALGSCGTTEIAGTSDQKVWAERYLTGYLYGAMSVAELASGDSSRRTLVDRLADYCWWYTDYAVAGTNDGQYCREYYEATITGSKFKTFGNTFGVGNSAAWPTARAGGVAAVSTRTVTISGVAPSSAHASATQVRCTLRLPDGTTSVSTVSSPPCSVTADLRQGSQHMMRLEYLTAGNAVVASGDWQIVTAQ